LARANKGQCEQLVAGLGDVRVSDRELAALYDAWRCADRAGKQRIVAAPLLVLRALAATATAEVEEPAPLYKDLTVLAAVAWRARRRVRGGDPFTAEHARAWDAVRDAFAALGATIEEMHAGSDHPTGHPEAP
jgi:hypothetical protein